MNAVSLLPLEAIYKFMMEKRDVEIWFEKTRMQGRIVGLDEYMNLVVDENGTRMIVKGECIFAIVPSCH